MYNQLSILLFISTILAGVTSVYSTEKETKRESEAGPLLLEQFKDVSLPVAVTPLRLAKQASLWDEHQQLKAQADLELEGALKLSKLETSGRTSPVEDEEAQIREATRLSLADTLPKGSTPDKKDDSLSGASKLAELPIQATENSEWVQRYSVMTAESDRKKREIDEMNYQQQLITAQLNSLWEVYLALMEESRELEGMRRVVASEELPTITARIDATRVRIDSITKERQSLWDIHSALHEQYMALIRGDRPIDVEERNNAVDSPPSLGANSNDGGLPGLSPIRSDAIPKPDPRSDALGPR
jgi:hypothetical protein